MNTDILSSRIKTGTWVHPTLRAMPSTSLPHISLKSSLHHLHLNSILALSTMSRKCQQGQYTFYNMMKKKSKGKGFSNLCANLKLALKTCQCKLRTDVLRSIRTTTIWSLSSEPKKEHKFLCSSEQMHSTQYTFFPKNTWDIHEEKPPYGPQNNPQVQKNCRQSGFTPTTK